MKYVNEFVEEWAKSHRGNPSVAAVAQDVLECVADHNCYLEYGQIAVLERALGDLAGWLETASC